MQHSRKPVKLNIDDAINMYLNIPITSPQLKSLWMQNGMDFHYFVRCHKSCQKFLVPVRNAINEFTMIGLCSGRIND